MNPAHRIDGESSTLHPADSEGAAAVLILGEADVARCEAGNTGIVADGFVFGINRTEGVGSVRGSAGLGFEEAGVNSGVRVEEEHVVRVHDEEERGMFADPGAREQRSSRGVNSIGYARKGHATNGAGVVAHGIAGDVGIGYVDDNQLGIRCSGPGSPECRRIPGKRPGHGRVRERPRAGLLQGQAGIDQRGGLRVADHKQGFT